MRKYGFLKHSLVDYPGEVCSVVFLPGCNFCCPYCHNKRLATEVDQYGWTLGDILTYLQSARSLVTAVCITGGEPTLMPETLKYLLQSFKQLGLKIKLDSNGSNPSVLKALLPQVDYVAMDLKTSIERYGELVCGKNLGIGEKIRSSMNLLMQRQESMYEFRTTLAWDFVDKNVIHALGRLLSSEAHWYLQRCHEDEKTTDIQRVHEYQKIQECFEIAKMYTKSVFLRE